MPKTFLSMVSMVLCALLLSACTTLTDMPLGTTASELTQKFGQPSVICSADGSTRLVWSTQPYGQRAWAATLDSQQHLTAASQVLIDNQFDLLNQGSWNQERVYCHFGQPAEKDITPYKGVKMQVWSYRYKQQGAWDSLMYVYFDDQGLVKHYHPGPDPLTTKDGELSRFF